MYRFIRVGEQSRGGKKGNEKIKKINAEVGGTHEHYHSCLGVLKE